MTNLPSNPSESTKKRNPHLWRDSDYQGKVEFKVGDAPKKRIRQSSKPLLNKLEAEYWTYLRLCFPKPAIHLQAVRLRLANGLWYKPDFFVIGPSCYAYEVKGPHAFRGGFENLKMAASKYPDIKWYLVWKDNTTGQWQEQRVLP